MKKQLSLIMLGLLLMSMMAFLPITNTAHGYTPADYKASVIKAADRLVALQSPTDYGWDWVVTGLTSHTASPSATNLYGITALGLIDAYELTGNAAYLTAAVNAGNFMKYGDPSIGDFWNGHDGYGWSYAADYIFLMRLSAVSGDLSYKTYALAAWVWQKANKPNYADGNQALLWAHYRDGWIGTGMCGAAALGTSEWGLATLEMGDTVWAGHMAVVIHANMANILSASVSADYKDMGMGEALKFLVTLDPGTYAADIASLIAALKADQLSDGSWDYGSLPGDPQTTSYVVSGLWAAGEYTKAREGADWLVTKQLTGGGWLDEYWGIEVSEPDSEALQATFTATSYASKLYISPSPVNMGPGDVGTTFDVYVKLENFGNLMGFDIKLTWDSSLITETSHDYTTYLNTLWGTGKWTMVFEASGAGYYELAATSTSTAASNAGASILFKKTFHIDTSCNFLLSTSIHFAVVKLSDNATPVPNPIVPTTVTDGQYTISGTKPDLEFKVQLKDKKTGLYHYIDAPYKFEYCTTFEVEVYVTHIHDCSPLTDYDLKVSFDPTLARFLEVDAWGIFGTGTVDTSVANIVHVSGVGSPWHGDEGLLFTLTFHVEFAVEPDHIWKYGNLNYMTFPISIADASLSFGTHGTILMSGITIPSPLSIEVDFIRGDVTCNGVVDLNDISTVAYWYGEKAPLAHPQYDLNNDGVIDIYDIVTVATNFGYGLDP